MKQTKNWLLVLILTIILIVLFVQEAYWKYPPPKPLPSVSPSEEPIPFYPDDGKE